MNTQAIDKTPAKPRSSDYTLYKPNGRGTGGALRFQLNRARAALFLEAANQSGEKQFDWEKKIIMKWALSDLGTVLAVLENRTGQAKLFHKTEKSNSAFELTTQDQADRAPYLVQISRQETATKQVQKVTIPMSHSEAAVVETALKTAVVRLLNW